MMSGVDWTVLRLPGRFDYEVVSQHQSINLRALKTIQGLFGPIHNWLVVVKGGIQNQGNSGDLVKSLDQPPVSGIRLRFHGLQSCGPIDM